MASPAPLAGLLRAIHYSLVYLGRWFLVGFVPLVLAGSLFGLDAVGIVFVHNIVSLLLLLPGAILINLVCIRRFRRHRWTNPAKSAWVAACTATMVTWFGYFFALGSYRFMMAWGGLAWFMTSLIGGSAIGLGAAWWSSGPAEELPQRGPKSGIPPSGTIKAH